VVIKYLVPRGERYDEMADGRQAVLLLCIPGQVQRGAFHVDEPEISGKRNPWSGTVEDAVLEALRLGRCGLLYDLRLAS